ncbi:MAG TPA: GIY-YIG nuclease family protein, partial [Candidatus Hodarchaeales archaeon]|nr:GIY-YIG nuclease family protein [Candidatus Hodarchaeales archaeon]
MDSNPELGFIPEMPGVYRFRNELGDIIYVGASKNLRKRVGSYFQRLPSHPRTQRLVAEIESVDYEVSETSLVAFVKERIEIGKFKPKYNEFWKRDDYNQFLAVSTQEEIPRLKISRKLRNDNWLYYGHRTQKRLIKKILNELRKLFPICDCSQPIVPFSKPRPCMNYDLRLCSGPCAGKITPEDYRKNVDQFLRILEGDTGTLKEEWEVKMEEAAKIGDFRKAIVIRERIRSLLH